MASARTDIPIIRPSGSDLNAEPTITLYTGQSANGIKISILLAELHIPYRMYKVDMTNKEQKALYSAIMASRGLRLMATSPWFIQTINPNGRIPAITDTLANGTPIRIFESGAIMQYLIDRYDTTHAVSYPPGSPEALETTSWLFWQMGGLGPIQGQAHYFVRYCPTGPNPAASERYVEETKRLYGVLNDHLRAKGSEYIVGDKCTVADIACWGWVTVAKWATVELDEFPALMAWEERMVQRRAVDEGRQVPDPHHRELLRSKERMEEFEKRGREFYLKMRKEAEEANVTEGKDQMESGK